MEFEKEYTKQEIEVKTLKIQVESLTQRVVELEKYYIQWLKLKKYYNLEEKL